MRASIFSFFCVVREFPVRDSSSPCMNRLGFSEEADCECGQSRETLTHVLLECSIEEEARRELVGKVQNLWMESKCSGNLNFDMKTLLCPFQVWNVTADLGSKILRESFCFLSKLTRKL